ncbi:hypothetical protein P4S68_06810 [Pseudoalteromonas sp. Hal099]
MITPESYNLMSNHLHGCKLSRDFAMDGEYTAAYVHINFQLEDYNVILGCAVGFQRAVGGSRPLVAIANAI